jgi:hypothetical protein
VFAGFPVLEIDAIVRRTLRSCAITGVIAVAASVALGHVLVAPGIVLGLALGLANHRVFQASAMRYMTADGKIQRKPFAGSTFTRLGICSAIALLLVFFVRPMGWGVIGGLAVFQIMLLLNALAALLRYQRSSGAADV